MNSSKKQTGISSEFLTRQQTADFLNLSRATLEAWFVRGGGPVAHKFGRSVRYKISDIEEFIEQSTRRNTVEP